MLESKPRGAMTKRYAYERPAAAPGMRDAKQRSVKDATCAKLELIVAGTSNEKNSETSLFSEIFIHETGTISYCLLLSATTCIIHCRQTPREAPQAITIPPHDQVAKNLIVSGRQS